MARYLFGPVTRSFADGPLREFRERGDCVAFGEEGTDLTLASDESWEAARRRLPSGWEPDFVMVLPAYASTPAAAWASPAPTIAVAGDWSLLWHHYRMRLRACEEAWADAEGAERLRRAGVAHAVVSPWTVVDAAMSDGAESGDRDIDVLALGNWNAAIFPERMEWLSRLARLGARRRVSIRSMVEDADTRRRWMRRARVVVHAPCPGVPNGILAEAACCGAAPVALGRAAADFSAATVVRAEEFEAALSGLLDDDAIRLERVRTAASAAAAWRFEACWPRHVAEIEGRLDELRRRRERRVELSAAETLQARTWQALSGPAWGDPRLMRDIEAQLETTPNASELRTAHGLALSRKCHGLAPSESIAEVAAESFRKAAEGDPSDVVAALHLAEAHRRSGRTRDAVDAARRAAAALERNGGTASAILAGGFFDAGYSTFRMEWERAAWANVGDRDAELTAKRHLLRWRIQRFLGAQTERTVHFHEAVATCPDLGVGQAELALALAKADHPVEALPHARRALTANPLDGDMARLAHQAMGHVGDAAGQRAFEEARRSLARAYPSRVPMEAWFSEPPPTEDDVASIVILCCDQLDYTRQCVESVVRNTQRPYELIFVDNGSTDGTKAYLEELKAQRGPARVAVVTNAENVGFSAGCNQGVRAARGKFVVLLNNDVVTTPGWLDGLTTWVTRGWPRVGMVGPVTNYAPPPQRVRTSYASIEDLDAFAARRRAAFRDRSLQVRRLTGFCLLLRRDLLERVGAFDERYGVGFFEDDDLGMRALEAGFELIVALDVHVHHYGSRTFRKLGVKTTDLLHANFRRFREKWGEEAASGFRVPQTLPEPAENAPLLPARADAPEPKPAVETTPATPRVGPKTTLSMIVKNEEKNLPACLESVAGLFEETVIADTGSTDRTVEVARRFGAKVVDFPWCDDFGAARNESLKHATGRWVMWLDADDRLTPENRERLRRVLAELRDGVDCRSVQVRSLVNQASDGYQSLEQVRLFPNHPDVRWDYRIHEQIFPAVRRLGGVIVPTDVVVDHIGYVEQATRRSKLERNIRLIEMDRQDRPNDPFTLFYFGWTSMDLGRLDAALEPLSSALALAGPDTSLARKLFALIAQAHRRRGERRESLRSILDGLSRFPDDAELLNERALLAWEKKDWDTVETAFARLLTTRNMSYFSSLDDGLKGYRTRHLLAQVYDEQRRGSEAEVHWRAAVRERPRFLPAWQGLATLALARGRWAEVDRVAERLAAEGLGADALVLRGKASLARGELAAARRLADEAIAAQPTSVRARILLTHVLLREGTDASAAEAAIREGLRLDPNNPALRHNLAVLLREKGEARPS